MPLIRSKSKAAFAENLHAELQAGKPLPQALAIAYSKRREAREAAKQKKGLARESRAP